MGLITEVLDTITGGYWSGVQALTGAEMGRTADDLYGGLTKAEQEQNRFNAVEADRAREFNAEQAQMARDWEEEFYNKYQSPSAQVAQYRDAGINPAVMFGQGPASPSPASAPVASGTPASGSGGAGFGQLLNWMVNVKNSINQSNLISAQKRNIDADTEQKQIENESLSDRLLSVLENTQADTDLKRGQTLVASASSDKIFKEIEALGVHMDLEKVEMSQKEAETILTSSKVIAQDIQNDIAKATAEDKKEYARLLNEMTRARTEESRQSAARTLIQIGIDKFRKSYYERYQTELPEGNAYFGLATALSGLTMETFGQLDFSSSSPSMFYAGPQFGLNDFFKSFKSKGSEIRSDLSRVLYNLFKGVDYIDNVH